MMEKDKVYITAEWKMYHIDQSEFEMLKDLRKNVFSKKHQEQYRVGIEEYRSYLQNITSKYKPVESGERPVNARIAGAFPYYYGATSNVTPGTRKRIGRGWRI